MAKTKDTVPMLDFELVVLQQFGDHERGKRISDAAEIQAVIDGDNLAHCIKIAKEAN
jgi:hypothetical protein